MTPERLAHLRWLVGIAEPGHCMKVEGGELLAEVDRMMLMLGDLLAVIHRDGGQHTDRHGLSRSTEDAAARVRALFDFADEIKALKRDDQRAGGDERIAGLRGQP